jgi:hypothetical protein
VQRVKDQTRHHEFGIENYIGRQPLCRFLYLIFNPVGAAGAPKTLSFPRRSTLVIL